MVETEKIYGETLRAVAPYVAIGTVGYLGLRWIGANNPLGGAVPDLGGGGGGPILNIFGGQQQEKEEDTEPGQEILKRETTGKRLEEQVDEEQREIQLEEQGLDFTTFEERDIVTDVREDMPDASEEERREEIARRRAHLTQKREAVEQMVEGLESDRFTTGKESEDKRLVRDYRQRQEHHEQTIQEEKEIEQERKGLDPMTEEERSIRERKVAEARQAMENLGKGDEEFTERQRRIIRRTEALERAEHREQQKEEESEPEKRTQQPNVVAEAGMQAAEAIGNVVAPGLPTAIRTGINLGSGGQQNNGERQTEEQRTGFHIPFT